MAQNASLLEFLETAVEAAKKAGEIIREGFYQTKHVEHKGSLNLACKGSFKIPGSKVLILALRSPSFVTKLAIEFNMPERFRMEIESAWLECYKAPVYKTNDNQVLILVDLVTETDKSCEDLIFNHLRKQYPSHKFIGEETTAANGVTELTDEPTWIVDPLDGTTNFVHGFPFVCTSIGLTIGKVPTVGVVYNPIMDELFTGILGKGAFLNGKPIKVSSQSELVKSLLASEVGTKRDKATVDATTDKINRLLFKVRSLRMSGSCALNLCGVACGRIDLFYETGYGGPWDVAGGAVIVKEAGGLVYDPSGKDFDITSQRVAASNPLLKDPFVEVLRQSK
ncbi:unnamed protein product [Dovyalis caffra]|uniref:Inositol-1-monophosphatase n=1 Tax=Dovyalis caffra TaxID=77055 RepID=A0AAV1QQK5_9ROSI|nr:unnamed protein product [Dovyalis caffra]